MKCLVRVQHDFVLNSTGYWQPVKLLEYWSNMVMPSRLGNEMGGGIFDSLEALNLIIGNRK